MPALPDAVTLWIDGLPPNPNTRRHWRQVYRDNQLWKNMAFYAAKQAYRDQPFERAKINFHISVGDNRKHDADNIIASLKPCVDGLVGVLIKDDDIDHIAVSYSFDRAKPRGVTILVFPLP